MDQPQRHGDTELAHINKITERIIGCAIEVHRILRCGPFEAVYRSALTQTTSTFRCLMFRRSFDLSVDRLHRSVVRCWLFTGNLCVSVSLWLVIRA